MLLVRSSRILCFYGTFTPEEKERIKKYVINPIESREASFCVPDRSFVQLVDDFVAVDVFVFQVSGTYGLVSLSVIVDGVSGDFFPRLELSVYFVSPADGVHAVVFGVAVFVP